MSLSLKLLKIVNLYVTLENVTGLLISGGRSIGRIGGADTETVSTEKTYVCDKDTLPNVRVPYIPGSSLKGRMRALLEIAEGLPLYSTDGKIWAHTISQTVRKDLQGTKITAKEFVNILTTSHFDKMFGYGSFHISELQKELEKELQNNKNQSLQLIQQLLSNLTPTSILFEDFFPSQDYVCDIYRRNKLVTFDDFIEDKSENRIDRVTSAADPRTLSRVKPGVKFDGKISLLVFDKNLPFINHYLNYLAKGLDLLEKTYIGAAGSRGYGRIKFTKISVKIYDTSTSQETPYGEYDSVAKFSADIPKLVDKLKSESAKTLQAKTAG